MALVEATIKSKDSVEGPCNKDLKELAYSPVDVQALELALFGYDVKKAGILLSGFQSGFNIHYSGPRSSRISKNLRSALSNPEIVQEKLDKEILAKRMAGPFEQKPFPNLIVSPVGVVPKKNPGEFRLIHHLSFPEGQSINDHIDREHCSVKYTNFDEAVHMIQDLGCKCKLFKIDLKNAFRLLPIRPEDFELLGIYFNNRYYVDKALPFGAAVSCKTFEEFSTFLEFFIKGHMSSGKIIHYLDDFLGGDKTYKLCQNLMSIVQNCLSKLKVPLAEEKTEGPSEVIVFLGLELDSVKMEVRIPRAKIEEVVQKIQDVINKKKTTLKQMQSLIGSLNFCCRAISAGRPFCRRLINATCGLSKPFHHLRVSSQMKLDLNMWLSFFENHNGISVFHDRYWVSNDDVQLFTDSAGGKGLGFGIFYQGHWCQARWPEAWHVSGITKDITALEIFPILVSIAIWGEEFRNKKIRFSCDNEAVVHILNTATSKSDRVMCIVRKLTLVCLELNIMIRASHLPGIFNSVCDALSRFQPRRFRELAPEADLLPVEIPSHLWGVFNQA